MDICPHSLGIAALGELDYLADLDHSDINNHHPMSFSPLIRRNSRLPADFTRTFYKPDESQTKAEVAIYQGESLNTRENTFIGSFWVELQNKVDSRVDIRFRL